MAWYQCPCGYLTEVTPRHGTAIASVSHLHRAARVDGSAVIVRMEEIGLPALSDREGRDEVAQGRPVG